ncbi:uncharacterized protein LOC110695196 [Chenopodium quinoa]|uniref:uncharacterized protein LOC110695196 n=1 Tax=Chenopodium quinoa TaxID=63459 RepID=UPI000B782ECA|nr:uncharacterized protein LOC110695196 [Chenopodium quinoa]
MADWNPNPNPNLNQNRNRKPDEDTDNDLVLVPRMRLDFNLVYKGGTFHYNPCTMLKIITGALKDIIGYRLSEQDIHYKSPVFTDFKRWEPIRDGFGDPGFFYIRDLSFIHQFPGDNPDQKFYNARQSIIDELRSKIFTAGKLSGIFSVFAFVKTSEDPLKFVNLIQPCDGLPPTIILKGFPSEWLADKSSIWKLLNSIGNVRDLDVSGNDVLVIFQDYEQCHKALQKLCLHSLKKNGDSRMVDYELTLKDWDISHEVFTCNESCNGSAGVSSNNQNPHEDTDKDLMLVPRMRIDFNVHPKGDPFYNPCSMVEKIASSVEHVIGYRISTKDIHLESSFPVVSTGYEYHDPIKYKRFITIGDPGFFYIRDLSFIDEFPGHDPDQKFYNARQSIINELRSKLFTASGSGYFSVLAFIKPFEDPLKFVNLIQPCEGLPPTIILKGFPSEWLADKSSIWKLLNSIGNVRDLYAIWNDFFVIFEDYEQCRKALQKLCLHSLKKNGDSKTVDYELTLKDSDISQEELTCNESCKDSVGLSSKQDPTIESSSLPLQLRVEMLEKELNTVKASLPLQLRVEMLEKELKTVKSFSVSLASSGNA